MTISTIAFDADDTLWDNEIYYIKTKEKFIELFLNPGDQEKISKKIDDIELKNFEYYGYGIKGFGLSLIETAIELTGGEVQGSQIKGIIDSIKEMLDTEMQPMPHAAETLQTLSQDYNLMMITKGDTFEQIKKISHSGLGGYFRVIEVLPEKNIQTYQALLKRYQIDPSDFMMVGNSLRSDISPVLTIGGTAVYIHYPSTWHHETTFTPSEVHREYLEVEHLGQLPGLLKNLADA